MVTDFIKAGIVPMIHGSPGIGKSQIVHQIAEAHGLKLVDMRLSQCDPTDLAGFPQIDAARGKAGYLPMDTFPLEGEAPPTGYNGWLLFFDEANSAPKAVQAAAYKILLDRMIGQHKLHKNCALVAAGNLESDGAIVEEMSTALQSRLAHIELTHDADAWVEWAQLNGVNHKITDFIKRVKKNPPHRVPGTAIFMASTASGVPSALLHNIKHNKVLHERVVILTVAIQDVPFVDEAERCSVKDLGQGFYRMSLRYGFLEETDVPAALKRADICGGPFEMMKTSFFLSRQTLLPSAKPGMALWREKLFAWMLRNAASAMEFFRLPTNRVVELGSQVEI